MMEFRIIGLEKLLKKLDGNALLGPPLRKAFMNAVLLLERESKQRAPVDTGRLRSSITHAIDTRPVPLWGSVGSKVHYAPYVEFGTKPHSPPLAALQPWARRHGFGPGTAGAFLVARVIAARGTKARRYFRGALESAVSRIQGYFDVAARAIEEMWGK
jgi:hypothetical protein